MSDKIVIDLTENFANIGQPIRFKGEYKLDDGLLPYPDAHLTSVVVDFVVTFVKPDVEIVGKIICNIQGFCDRCLDPVSEQIELPFDQVFYKNSSDEVDNYIYCGSQLDATKAVHDEIVLSIPSNLLCSPDCKGLCPRCGTNLNREQCDCDLSGDNAFSVLKNLKF